MPKFACCDFSIVIRQVDSDNPSQLAYPIHNSQSDVSSLAFRADKEFNLAWGTGGSELRQTKGQTDVKLYEHPRWIWTVRVRNVAGKDRVYFSSPRKDSAPLLVDIFMYTDGAVSLYTTIDSTKLTFPHPCNPAEDAYSYGGDFVFGDGDVMYLSTGNWSGFKVGVYRLTGAGPDKVTGTIERIFLTDGPVQRLCFESPQTLYFMRTLGEVWKLDLSTLSEMFVMSIKLPPYRVPHDITLVGAGVAPIFFWVVFSKAKTVLDRGAASLWRFAEALLGTPRRRTPDE